MIFWVRVKFHATGDELTHEAHSACARGLFIILTSKYADVLAQGECGSGEASTESLRLTWGGA